MLDDFLKNYEKYNYVLFIPQGVIDTSLYHIIEYDGSLGHKIRFKNNNICYPKSNQSSEIELDTNELKSLETNGYITIINKGKRDFPWGGGKII